MLLRTLMSKRPIRMAGSVVVLSVAVAISGCGSDSDTTSATAPTTTTTLVAATTGTSPTVATEATSDTVSTSDAAPTTPAIEEPVASTTIAVARADAVAFLMNDKYTLYEDGPGTVMLAGVVKAGVLRPGDVLEILDGGPETSVTILNIRVGAPTVEVDSLATGEFGNLLVTGELADFTYTDQFVRPTG